MRRDKKHRVLRRGESIRSDGKYQFKYYVNGKPKFLYSWRLVPTDPLPQGKRAGLSLREQEKKLGKDLESQIDPDARNMTVMELVERYLETRIGVRGNTKTNYNFVKNCLLREEFSAKKIKDIRTSDAKLFLIKLQKEGGKGYSTVKTIRGVLRPAFQMAVDDDMLIKNPFDFQLVGVVINDSIIRQSLTREQMRDFLKFIYESQSYRRYYEAVYILFHTGMRISEFCGLTVGDIDLENRIVNIDHQLQRMPDMSLEIQPTKTNAGTRKLPITEDVAEMFAAILKNRKKPKVEKMVDGYSGFLFLDKDGLPEVAMHWEHRFNHMVHRYNDIYKVQMPNISPHICRHTYCTNMARSGMNPKTLQYLMGHSDISVTMNTYTHLGLDDARDEMIRMEELEQARQALQGGDKVKPIGRLGIRAV